MAGEEKQEKLQVICKEIIMGIITEVQAGGVTVCEQVL